jgi:hypothetical protein
MTIRVVKHEVDFGVRMETLNFLQAGKDVFLLILSIPVTFLLFSILNLGPKYDTILLGEIERDRDASASPLVSIDRLQPSLLEKKVKTQ